MIHGRIEATLLDRIPAYAKLWRPWIAHFLPQGFEKSLLEPGPFTKCPILYKMCSSACPQEPLFLFPSLLLFYICLCPILVLLLNMNTSAAELVALMLLYLFNGNYLHMLMSQWILYLLLCENKNLLNQKNIYISVMKTIFPTFFEVDIRTLTRRRSELPALCMDRLVAALSASYLEILHSLVFSATSVNITIDIWLLMRLFLSLL